MAAAPSPDGAEAVLVVVHLIDDGGFGRGHAEREVVLLAAAIAAIAAVHRKAGLMDVELMVRGRELKLRSSICER